VKNFIIGGVLAASLLALIASPFITSVASAHEGPCPYCSMPITQDTATQDNEVALKIGRKRIEYKCVYCAVAEAHTEYKGDLSIYAPSEKKGEPVVLKRTGDRWSVLPSTAYFVSNNSVKHRTCEVQARAFTTEKEALSYAKEKNLKAISLEQLVASAK
jgi:hypothetical protein